MILKFGNNTLLICSNSNPLSDPFSWSSVSEAWSKTSIRNSQWRNPRLAVPSCHASDWTTSCMLAPPHAQAWWECVHACICCQLGTISWCWMSVLSKTPASVILLPEEHLGRPVHVSSEMELPSSWSAVQRCLRNCGITLSSCLVSILSKYYTLISGLINEWHVRQLCFARPVMAYTITLLTVKILFI